MDEKPYKFESSNPRIATNVEDSNNVYYLSGAIFSASIYMYSRKKFRIDQNAFNFLLFTGASTFASYQWAATFLRSPINEAGLLNNANETQSA